MYLWRKLSLTWPGEEAPVLGAGPLPRQQWPLPGLPTVQPWPWAAEKVDDPKEPY